MFDYERSVSDAFRLWTIHILRHEQSLRFISAANRYATPLSSVEYSWVPDWNLQHDGLGSPERPGDFKTTQGSKLSFKLGDNDTILGLEGYTVDSVVAVGGVMDTSYDAKRIFGSVENGLKVDEQEVWRSWEQVAQIRRNRVYEATGQSISDAYGQTISYGSPIIRDDEAASGRNAYREWYLYQQPWRKTRLLHMSRHMWCLSAWLLTQWGLGRTGSSNRKRNVGILQFSERVVHARHRRMIRTGQGYIGLAAHGAKVGDRVALFQGGPDPLIIRPTGKQRWILVGEAYLHGIMQGELWNPKKCETFWIC